jgi:Uma2 family endonuclease
LEEVMAMSTAPTRKVRMAEEPEPNWEVAYLFPACGQWTEEEYLELNTTRRVELVNGSIEVLPVPTISYQRMLAYLFGLLSAFVTSHDLGEILFAGTRVRLRRGQIREPDVVFLAKEHADRETDDYWKGADLVLEMVSGSKKDRKRDLVTKRAEYARAGIPEYWIVDPEKERITVLKLAGKRYTVHGEFGRGETATSVVLPGFSVDVTEVFSRAVPAAKKARKPKRKPRS